MLLCRVGISWRVLGRTHTIFTPTLTSLGVLLLLVVPHKSSPTRERTWDRGEVLTQTAFIVMVVLIRFSHSCSPPTLSFVDQSSSHHYRQKEQEFSNQIESTQSARSLYSLWSNRNISTEWASEIGETVSPSRNYELEPVFQFFSTTSSPLRLSLVIKKIDT